MLISQQSEMQLPRWERGREHKTVFWKFDPAPKVAHQRERKRQTASIMEVARLSHVVIQSPHFPGANWSKIFFSPFSAPLNAAGVKKIKWALSCLNTQIIFFEQVIKRLALNLVSV